MIIIPRQRLYSNNEMGAWDHFKNLIGTSFRGRKASDGNRYTSTQAKKEAVNSFNTARDTQKEIAGGKLDFFENINARAKRDSAMKQGEQFKKLGQEGFFKRSGQTISDTWNSGTSGKVAVAGTAALALGTTAAAAALLNRRKKKKRQQAAQQNGGTTNNSGNQPQSPRGAY